jgi:ABC-type glycerol-3-phosphate transport system substrate-binding protein
LRKLYLALLPALLLALALGLAACGGGGESDEDKIVSTVESAATSNDASVCSETQTLSFMEQTSGSSGKEAEKECEKEAESGEDQPDSVKVSKVEVDGESATADAEFKGGPFDAQTLELALVEEDGDWKLNELSGFAKFDSDSLVNVFAEQIEEDPSIEPETASCFVEGIEELSDPELESVVLEDNTEVFGEIAESCE